MKTCYARYALSESMLSELQGLLIARVVFLSPRNPSRAMSKNAVSYFIREVISESGASRESSVTLCPHSIRGIATSTAFHKNKSVSSVLDMACWRSSSVFASFFQEYEETCLFIIARFSASESLRVYINILKIPPPFASSDGYPASGIRYESVGA